MYGNVHKQVSNLARSYKYTDPGGSGAEGKSLSQHLHLSEKIRNNLKRTKKKLYETCSKKGLSTCKMLTDLQRKSFVISMQQKMYFFLIMDLR